MWNSKMQEPIDDDSWEVRAFAEDTNHAMGTTWPPRSYTCTFCRREFKSAQALGGHMNVHRRDRAQLHHTQPKSNIPTHQDLFASGGLCLLYSLQNPNPNPKGDSPSPFLSISPYNFIDFPAVSSGIDASMCHKELPSGSKCEKDPINLNGNYGSDRPAMEELDLELRLGPSSSVPS